MGETLDPSKYEAGQDVKITRKEEGQEWSFDNWGDCRFQIKDGTAEEGNLYTDARITQRLFTEPMLESLGDRDKSETLNLVDFGGGAGIMLSQINQQLKEAGFEQINPVLVDRDDKKVRAAQSEYPELHPVVGDTFHLPFPDNSIDAGVSRNVIQYFSPPYEESDGPNQLNFLKEIHRVMKPDSTFVLVWPGAHGCETREELNRAIVNDVFWADLTWQRTGDDSEDPHKTDIRRTFTVGEMMAHSAKETGFEVISGEEEDWIEFRYTEEAFMSRFGRDTMSEEQQKAIEERFSPLWVHGMDLDSIDWHGKQAIRMPISRLVLRKTASK